MKIIQNNVIQDSRGSFCEIYNIFNSNFSIKQINRSVSIKNVLRGLHIQTNPKLCKILSVLKGNIYLISVNIETTKIQKEIIKDSDDIQIYVNSNELIGFYVLSETAVVQYLYSENYNKYGEFSVLWNDADLKIDWPTNTPILSERDKNAVTFKEFKNSYYRS